MGLESTVDTIADRFGASDSTKPQIDTAVRQMQVLVSSAAPGRQRPPKEVPQQQVNDGSWIRVAPEARSVAVGAPMAASRR